MKKEKLQKADLSEVQYIAPARLKPHPENDFRDIDGEEYRNLRDSIRRRGVLHPILVDSEFRVLSGAQRTRAATDLGLAKVPVLNMGRLTRARARELVIDANLCQRHLTKEEFGRYFAERYGRMIEEQLKTGATAGDLIASITATSGLDKKRVGYRVRLQKALLETATFQTVLRYGVHRIIWLPDRSRVRRRGSHRKLQYPLPYGASIPGPEREERE